MPRNLLALTSSLALAAASSITLADVTGSTGGNAPIDNNQPSLVLPMFITTEGFPNIGVHIRTFAYSPETVAMLSEWVLCDGRSLPRAGNASLFQQIGVIYGFETTADFKMPDLRGRTPMGEGISAYPNGPIYPRNDEHGNATYTLTLAHLPEHEHAVGGGTLLTEITGSPIPAAIDTRQPTRALNYTIHAQNGHFPMHDDGTGTNGGAPSPMEPLLGQFHLMAGDPAPNYGAMPCDGHTINDFTNTAFFSIIGFSYGGNNVHLFAIPDMRGRVAIGANLFQQPGGPGLTPHLSGEYTGEMLATLIPGHLPSHTHATPGFMPPQTGPTGGNLGYQNMQPSTPAQYVIAANGVFPSSSMDDLTGYVGEIILFAGHFIPAGHFPCDGRALSTTQHEVLFMLLGTTFGSAGPGTFRIPDLRGRVVVGPSDQLAIGTYFGTEQTVMTEAQMPAHTHTYTLCPADLGVAGGNPGHDGVYDNNDFIAFIEYFFTQSAQADMGIQGGLPGHDNAWDNNDFIVFIDVFFDGCP